MLTDCEIHKMLWQSVKLFYIYNDYVNHIHFLDLAKSFFLSRNALKLKGIVVFIHTICFVDYLFSCLDIHYLVLFVIFNQYAICVLCNIAIDLWCIF